MSEVNAQVPSDYTAVGVLGSDIQQNLTNLDVQGRYVYIQLPGSGKILSLAEVQVFGPLSSARSQATLPRQRSKWSDRVTLYPNPASNKVYIQLESSTEESGILSLNSSVTGQLVKQFPIQISRGENVIELDISDIPNGLYYLNHPKGISQKLIILK